MDDERLERARRNLAGYLREGVVARGKLSGGIAFRTYLANAELSLAVASELSESRLKPHLWVVVASYYSMFYAANALLLALGYRTTGRIAHKATSDCLYAVGTGLLGRSLAGEYEDSMGAAIALAGDFESERRKRSAFQYEMGEIAKADAAALSLERAKRFVFQIRRALSETRAFKQS